MAAKDMIHDVVKNALIKDGWTITHDPYLIEYEEVRLSADLGAERPIAAERGNEKIVVEVQGYLEGQITSTARGKNGFGYDPIFCLPDRRMTVAELDYEEKNAISHRGQALKKLLERLRPMLVG